MTEMPSRAIPLFLLCLTQLLQINGTSEGQHALGQVEEMPQTPQIAAGLKGDVETTASRQQAEALMEEELPTSPPPSPGVSEAGDASAEQERTAASGEEILTREKGRFEGPAWMAAGFLQDIIPADNQRGSTFSDGEGIIKDSGRGRPADDVRDKLADEEEARGEKAGEEIPDLVPRSVDDMGITGSWRLEHLDPSLSYTVAGNTMRLFARAGRPPFLISLDLSSWTQAEPPPPPPPPPPSPPPSGSSSQSPPSPHLLSLPSSSAALLKPTSPLPSRTSFATPAFSVSPSSPILSAFSASPVRSSPIVSAFSASPSSPFISAFSASFIPPSSVAPALPASSNPSRSTPAASSGRLSSLPLSLSLEPPRQVSPSASASSTRPLSHSPSSPSTPTPEDPAFPSMPKPTQEDLVSPPVPTPMPEAPASPPTPSPSPTPVPPAQDALAVLRFPTAGGSSVAYVLRDCGNAGQTLPADVVVICPQAHTHQQRAKPNSQSQQQPQSQSEPEHQGNVVSGRTTHPQQQHSESQQLQRHGLESTQQGNERRRLPRPFQLHAQRPQQSQQLGLPHLTRSSSRDAPTRRRTDGAAHVTRADAVTSPNTASPEPGFAGENPAVTSAGAARPLATSLTDAPAGGPQVTAVPSPAPGHELSAGMPDPSTDPLDADPHDPALVEADPSGASFAELPDDTDSVSLEGTAADYDASELSATGTGDPTARGEGAPEQRSSRESVEGGWEGPRELDVPGMRSTDHVEEEDGVHVIPESMTETSLRTPRHGGVEVGGDGGLRRSSRDLGLHYPRPAANHAAPQLQYTFIEQTVSPGSPVNLKCSAVGSPFPLITWTRDHRPLHTSLRTNVGSFRTALGEVVSHVNLSDVTVRDGGTYACTAHNTLGSVSHSARVNVYGPPFVRAMPNVTAVAGEDVRLWCPAGGFPTPSITWRKNGQVIPTSLRQEVLGNGTLVLRTATNKDVGRYSCVVTGRQGQTASSHTFLHVLKPPVIEKFGFRADLEEEARTQLSCMVTDGDLPFTINWLKDGRHLQHDPDVESKQTSDFSTVLVFKRLHERHSGAYTCEAANAAAAVNHTAILRVKVSPRWVVEPGSGTALVAETVVMDCSARGFPEPVITWMKAPGKVAQDFQQVVLDGVRTSQAPNGSLVLMSANTADAGWYMCQATNDVGQPLSKVVQLTVHAPARVVTERGRVTGHAGQTVTVTCEAAGDDPLELTWLRHHVPVSPSHRVLVRESSSGGLVRAVLEIRAVTAADAGEYTCRATNPHGHHAQMYEIAIIEPPTAPSGVSVTDVTSRSARISWSLPQPAAVTIQYRAAEEESWAVHGRNVSVGQWASSHVLSGLTPYQAYAVRLMAHNDLGVSQPSHMHVFTTLEEAPSGAPRDVRLAAGGPRSLIVTWRPPSPNLLHGTLRGYTIAIRRQNLQGHLTFITRPASVPKDADGFEQYQVRGLIPATLYEVAVRAFTRAGPGPLSTPRIVDSTSHDAPSCPPAGVSCRGSGRGVVRVWWSQPPTHCSQTPVAGYTIVATPTTHTHHPSDSTKWEVNTTNLEKNLDSLPPATNISVRVKAFNNVGYSPSNKPVFCVTEDDIPGAPGKVQVTVTGPRKVLVTWVPPQPPTGNILHYTLYSVKDDQVRDRDVVGAAGSESTWRELRDLAPSSRIEVWVTATTAAGEGNPSPRLTALLKPTATHAPVALGGGRTWRVGAGAGVTLGCRGRGKPAPSIVWSRGGQTITSGQFTQLLPGGDLHLTGVRETANYTCKVSNTMGVDSLTHHVIVVTMPPPPTLSLAYATHDALNLTIVPTGDGGAPILGYTVHHRGRAGEWVETEVDPGVESAAVRGLPCGAPHHLYLTAWNSHGTSPPSPVLEVSTHGAPPGRPNPAKIVEVNATCVTLRLYAWPESGCPVTHWKVEQGSEDPAVLWTPLHAHVTRDMTDLGLCDLTSASRHLLRLTASSTAGDTTVVYRVTTRDHTGGSIAAESVQEVQVSGPPGVGGWLDAHVVAGVVSALLLAAALIICVCVAVRRRRYGGYRQGESLDNKGGGEDDNARNSELTRAHLYSPTPTKKPRGSLASLKTQDDASDPYEICPYATFSDRHPHEAPGYAHPPRQRAQSHYKETELAYISNRSRGEYITRPKSIPGSQPTPAPTPAPTPTPIPNTGATETRAWAEDPRKDTRSRPHRSRSRNRADSVRRDSSTESNDASSPVQQRHYQQPQHHHHPLPQPQPQHQGQGQQPQPQQAPQGTGPTGPIVRVGPHPLPPVRHARARTESSSSESSPLTPPRPLHPPSAFSDSRELSEAECDREIFQSEGGSGGGSRPRRQSEGEDIKAELTVLLQRYKQQQEVQQQQLQQAKASRGADKNPYTINV